MIKKVFGVCFVLALVFLFYNVGSIEHGQITVLQGTMQSVIALSGMCFFGQVFFN